MPVAAFDIEQSAALVVVRLHPAHMGTVEAQSLADELTNRMRNDGAHYFVLDMAEVRYIDSGCLGTLVQLLQDLEHIRGRIALANCGKNVAFLFKVTRLDSVFGLYDDVEEARREVVRG